MKTIVADTSALIRLYLPDGPLPEDFENHIDSAWQGETIIFIPEIALAEAAQVIWKKQQAGVLKENEADEVLSAFLDLPLEVVGHRDLLIDALSLARLNDLTVYDGLFLALAIKLRAELITADKKLNNTFNNLSKS